MELYNNKKPVIAQGWLRALFFCIFYFLVLLIAGVLLALLLKHDISADLKNTANTQLIYFAVAVNAALAVGIVWFFMKWIDRRSFTSLGFTWNKHGAYAGTGFFLGILLLCTGTLVLYFTKHLQWTGSAFNAQDMFIGLGLMILVAVYEEVVFRGYILNNLLQSFNKRVALLLSALLFTLAHTSNPGFSVLAAVNIFFAGVLLGINYMYTKNLWFGIMLHFSWNFFQGPILGYNVSGLGLRSLFQQELNGKELMTGGNFGFEGSIIATLLYLLAIVVLAMVYEKKFSRQSSVGSRQSTASSLQSAVNSRQPGNK